MQTETEIVDRFSNMILGVNLASSLEQNEKDYIIEMLNEELQTELHCRNVHIAMMEGA